MAVEACHRASLVPPPLGRGDASQPSIVLNFSPWYSKFKGGTNASSTVGEQAELDLWNTSLAEVKGWIAQSNRELGAAVAVGAVALDSEQFAYSPTTQTLLDKAAVRRKNELIYNLVRSHFPNRSQTVIIFYDYGASEYYPRSPREDWLTVTAPGTVTAWSPNPPRDGMYHAPAGWVTGINHATFDESFAQEIPFSFSAYAVHQSELTRTKFIVTAESARAQHANGGTARVIPYISLGGGYRPNTSISYASHHASLAAAGSSGPPELIGFPTVGNGADFPYDRVCYDVGFDPDLSYASMLGGLINQGGVTFNSSGCFAAFGPWELVTGAVFFPSVFETSCAGKTADPGAGGCVANSSRLHGSTNLFDHFLSYIAGARGDYTTAPAARMKIDDRSALLAPVPTRRHSPVSARPRRLLAELDDFSTLQHEGSGWSFPVFQYNNPTLGNASITDGVLQLHRAPGGKFEMLSAQKNFTALGPSFGTGSWVHARVRFVEMLLGADLYITAAVSGAPLFYVGVNGEQHWKMFANCEAKLHDDELFFGGTLNGSAGGKTGDFRASLAASQTSSNRFDEFRVFSLHWAPASEMELSTHNGSLGTFSQ